MHSTSHRALTAGPGNALSTPPTACSVRSVQQRGATAPGTGARPDTDPPPSCAGCGREIIASARGGWMHLDTRIASCRLGRRPAPTSARPATLSDASRVLLLTLLLLGASIDVVDDGVEFVSPRADLPEPLVRVCVRSDPRRVAAALDIAPALVDDHRSEPDRAAVAVPAPAEVELARLGRSVLVALVQHGARIRVLDEGVEILGPPARRFDPAHDLEFGLVFIPGQFDPAAVATALAVAPEHVDDCRGA